MQKEIGHSAKATVYLGWHKSLRIPVAVKVITKQASLEIEGFSHHFMREATLAAQLTHSNIVRVYDCGETADEYYLIMEYVEGESCRDRIQKQGAFDWRSAVQMARQVAEGLNYAYKKGVIHRDIKPENIMIDSSGDARIADLGLAKQLGEGVTSATVTGHIMGTPYYMSPEQIRQPKNVDFRADMYSLGATMYHMVTGEVPFEAATPFEVLTKHLNEPVPRPQDKKHDLPEAFGDVIVRAMAKKADDRYQSYDELIEELDRVLEVEPEPQDVMGPLEASMAEAAMAEKPAPLPRLQPVLPVKLPATTQNVLTKLLGVLAFLAYVSWLVCLHQLLLSHIGMVAAVPAMVGMLLVSVGWGYSAARRRDASAGAEELQGPHKELTSALGPLCERLALPTPSVRLSSRQGHTSSSYSFFSRKATIHLPWEWMQKAELNEEETEALLAQSLGSVYAGDSDFRTLLAVPVGLLEAGRRLLASMLSVAHSRRPRTKAWVAQAATLVGLAAVCAIIATLFSLSVLGGVLALLLLGVLLLTGGFERRSCYVGDAFAAIVTENDGAVKSLIVASGLAGVEGHRLLVASADPNGAEQWSGDLPPLSERRQLADSIASHYTEVEHSPNMLEMASKLFSVAPFAADRLNRLAGIPRRRSPVIRTLLLAKRIYVGISGTDEGQATSMLELAEQKVYAAMGAIGGALLVAVMAFLALAGSGHYVSFLIAAAALGAALGFVVGRQVLRESLSVDRLSWALVVSSVFFTCTAMIGFCLAGWRTLCGFAVQCPIGFVLILLLASAMAALLTRLVPHLSIKTPLAGHDADAKTAHAAMASSEEQQAPADKSAAARPSQGAAEGPTEKAPPQRDASAEG